MLMASHISAGHEGDLEKKAGMQRLGAGESASYDYVVEFY